MLGAPGDCMGQYESRFVGIICAAMLFSGKSGFCNLDQIVLCLNAIIFRYSGNDEFCWRI